MDESTLFLRVIAHYAKAFWFMIVAGLFFYNSGVIKSWGAESLANCRYENANSYLSLDCEFPAWATFGTYAMWIGSIIFITLAVKVAGLAHEGLRAIEEVE
jgi:hypothetical protein